MTCFLGEVNKSIWSIFEEHSQRSSMHTEVLEFSNELRASILQHDQPLESLQSCSMAGAAQPAP